MKKQLIYSLLIILAISVIITIIFSNIFGGNNWSFMNLLLNVLYGFIIGSSISLSGLVTKFVFRISDIRKFPSRTYVLLLISVFLFITIDVIIVNLFWYHFIHGYEFVDVYKSTGILLVTVITIFIGLTIFFIILSNSFIKNLVSAEKETQHAKDEASQAKYDTLKSQINPHFLFNSLNTLSSLISIDAKKADEFINKLSRIYMYILDHQDDELVMLKEELGFAEKFAYLQSIRFDDNFSLDIKNIRNADKCMIIPFSLQLLMENIFKHNIISEQKKVRALVFIEDDYLIVTNNKTEKKDTEASHNVGLNNIINRYEHIGEKQCVVEETPDTFTVKLPLIAEN